MKTLRRSCVLLFAAVCLIATSCDSENPLSDPATAKVDQKLLGVWRKTDKNGTVNYYHIGLVANKNTPPGMLRMIPVEHRKNGEVPSAGELFCFTSEIGGAHYLNIAIAEKENVEKIEKDGWNPKLVATYTILKYEITGDMATVWGINADVKRRAIESGKLQGKIKKSNMFDEVYFTDTSENIAKFLADPANANLFEKKETYQRVK